MACDTEFETAAIEAQAAIARAGRKQSGLDVSRRSVIGGATTLFTSAFLPNGAHGATDPDARLLVVILRGGMDGMNVVVPKLDPLYPSLRRELAIPASSTLSLGADFGLHPALANLHAMFTAGDAAFIPAAGLPLRNRSHFECQDNLENGLPANTPNATGWLNRLLGALPAGDPIRVRRGIGIGPAPLILRGPEPVFGWSPTWFQKITPANLERLRQLYVATDPMLWNTLAQGVIADSQASNAGAGGNSGLSVMRQCFIGAGVLMRTAGGPRIGVLSVDNWDMHADEGTVTSGDLRDRLLELDQAINDFKAQIGSVWGKTVGICVTEFGRTIEANGSRGTDHGIASASLLFGGAVKRGIVGNWPGLAPADRFDGDLRPTVDLRAVFKGILRDHIGVPTATLENIVFPGSASAPAIANLVDAPLPPSATLSSTTRLSPEQQRLEAEPIARYRKQFGVS